MLVYIALPMCSLPTMMVTLAVGAHPTSAHCLKTLPLTPENIEVSEAGSAFSSNMSSLINLLDGTFCYTQNCIANPMPAAADHSNHHD